MAASLIIREMQIKITMRYHIMLVRMAIIKILQIINAGEGVKKRDPSFMICGNVHQHSHYRQHYECALKNLKTELTYDLTIPLLGIYTYGESENSNLKRYMHQCSQ